MDDKPNVKIEVPQTQWYQWMDRFTSMDEILRQQNELLAQIAAKEVLIPPPANIPITIDDKLAKIIELLENIVKTPENMKYDSVSVGTSVTAIVNSNPNRFGLIIRNISAFTIYIGKDKNLTTDKGFKLSQNDAYEINSTNLYKGPIFAVTSAGTSDVRVMEFW